MNIEIIRTPRISTPIPSVDCAPPPSGYALFVARKWGDKIVVDEANLSTAYFQTSNFQVNPVFTKETSSFSATAANHSYYVRSKGDMDAIWNLQPKDGRTKEATFNPIIATGNYVKTMWTNSELGWDEAPEWVAGSQLYGGQMFAATIETFSVYCQRPNTPAGYVQCRKVYPFKREHFKLSHETHPWLINKYTVAFRKPVENTYSETFNGLIRYLPMQCLDPADFKFAGSKTPTYYTPVNWSVPVV